MSTVNDADLSELGWKQAVELINSHFDDDANSLEKARELQSTIAASKHEMENQLSYLRSAAPNKIEKAIEEATNISVSVAHLQSTQDEMISEVSNHLDEATPLVEKLSTLTAQIRDLEKCSSYLMCLSQFEDFSSDIQSALLINSVERSVVQYTYLVSLANDIRSSQCHNLVSYAEKNVLFWYRILKETLSSEFEKCLQAWSWPFIISTAKNTPVIANAAELREKLGNLFALLTQLQLPDNMSDGDKPVLKSIKDHRPILLPVQILLLPFKKRFVFHFTGNKKTNSLEKPEWYFTQILTWIADHKEFLINKIQPELDKSGFKSIDVLVEFARGLVSLVMEKMLKDMPAFLESEVLFAHLVDETLAFHRELHNCYNYLDSLPNCLHVLVEPESFRRWMSIEKKFALEKMDAMLSSPSAWTSQYSADIDELKVSECGEGFMVLMSTITDRYKLIPSKQHRLEFVRFQLELLDDFRIRLVQVRKELVVTTPDPAIHRPQYSSILNTVSYIANILRQWSNFPFFVGVQHYKQLIEGKPTRSNERRMDEDLLTTELSTMEPGNMEVDDATSSELEVSLFDDMIELLELMQRDMMQFVMQYVISDVKKRAKPYRRDKWLALPSHKDFLSLALSNSACEMLRVTKEHLHQMELLLNKNLFCLFWQQLSAALNSFIYKDIIQANHFNEGGAMQLQFDMTRNLFPLFAPYTSKPENFFKDVKEACIVLTLAAGSALLMKDIIYQALHQPVSHHKSKPTDPIAALQDIGIYKLLPEEVELLLSLRIDLQT